LLQLKTSAYRDLLYANDLLALPIMPTVMEALLETCESRNIDVQKQAQLIGYDPVLSLRLLTMEHAAQGQTSQPPNLQNALAIINPTTLRTLVVASALQQSAIQRDGFPTPALKRFWRHSLCCAHLARRLAEITGFPDPETAYLAGLLHDLGKLALSVHQVTAPDEIHTLSRIARTLTEVPELEQRLLGADHCTLGAALLDSWKLPPLLSDAIRYHHLPAPELRGAHPLLGLLHVANALSQETGCAESVLAEEGELLGLSSSTLEQARTAIEPLIELLISELGIATTDAENEAGSASLRGALPDAIHEIALIDAMRSELGNVENISEIGEAIARCAALFFDLTEAHFFHYDTQTGLLHHHSSATWPDPFTIDPAGATNAFQRAAREQQIHHSLEPEIPPGIIDQQLARQWESAGVWCLPLHAGDRLVGVLGAGISGIQLPSLQAGERLLRRFAATAAITLDDLNRREIRQRRVREDRELLQRQQLRTVLHEVSNPLTIVRNSLYLLAAKVGEQAAEELRVLREETERASRILQRLAEPEEPLAESSFDLNKTIRDLARVLDEALCRPHGIGLSLNLQEKLAPLPQGRDAMRQIVLNLVRNAAEALGERGHISVTTQDGINLHGRLYVEIAVADDGPGFPETLRAQLFQPVTSAKGEGHAGLGLSIVKNLVDELGGLVSCRPNLGGGTIFLILLPQVQA
jgi:putative nucleotidyltransferase with HDIG domain